MKKTIFTVVFVCFVFINNTVAQVTKDCSKAKTQADINECTEQQYKKADVELNEFYRRISSKLDKTEKAFLIQSQRNWISYRDSFAKIYAHKYQGGSAASSIVLDCKTKTTRARIVEFKELWDELNH